MNPLEIKELEPGLFSVEQANEHTFWVKRASIQPVLMSVDLLRILYHPMWAVVSRVFQEALQKTHMKAEDIREAQIICITNYGDRHPENEYALILSFKQACAPAMFPFNLSVYHRAGMRAILEHMASHM